MSMYPEASSPIGSPYTPAGSNNMGGASSAANPNQMGIGMNTGSMAPVARQMQGMGRGEDSMLIHMTPGEVGGLQALAKSQGGSLTINPHTGLPEAGFLSSLLPMVLGGLLTMTGVGAPLAALMVGGGTGLATGSLKKGLMAGLGAFGGAGLAGGLTSALGSGVANAATSAATAGTNAAALGADAATTAALTSAPVGAEAAGLGLDAATAGSGVGSALGTGAANAGTALGISATPTAIVPEVMTAANPANIASASDLANIVRPPLPSLSNPELFAPDNLLGNNLGATAGRFQEGFSQAAGRNLIGTGSTPSLMKTGIAALGAGMPVLEAMQPTYKPYKSKEDNWNYEGPYKPTKRTANFLGPNPSSDSSEHLYFNDVNPYPGYETATGGVPYINPPGMAAGGSTFAPSARGAAYGAGQGAAAPVNFDALRAMMMQQPTMRPRTAPPAAAPAAAPPAAVGEKMHNFGPAGAIPTAGFGGFHAFGRDFGFLNGGERYGGDMPEGRTPQRTAADYFLNPATGRMELKPSMAKGGMHLEDGAFIVDARTVSELGNGSSRAGQDLLARHGGQTLHGPGDGVSDSIKANIGGRQEARVARDEVKFSPDAVARIGGGNANQGAKKLYALMDKAQKARKSAKRGQDTGLKGAL